MKTFFFQCLLVALVCVNAGDQHGSSRTPHRHLQRKLDELEAKIESLQKPVHVHVYGDDEDSASKNETDGTHVHIHVNLDERQARPVCGRSSVANEEYSYASCFMRPNLVKTSNHSVTGFVYLRQKPSSQLEMKIDFSGFIAPGKYGFHVHENPSFQQGCNSFGGHLNPYDKNHGGPLDEERHLGDWGNVEVDANMTVKETRTDRMASLFGPDAIIGHGIDPGYWLVKYKVVGVLRGGSGFGTCWFTLEKMILEKEAMQRVCDLEMQGPG